MTTVADVVADGLARAGTVRVFATRADRRAEALLDAVERRGLAVVSVARPDVACVMAAVCGAFDGVPGAAMIGAPGEAARGLGHAFHDRAPMVVVTDSSSAGTEPVGATLKASLAVAAGSAAHWTAHACQLAMKEPRGPVHLAVSGDVATAPALPVATSCRPAPAPAPEAGSLDSAARVLGASERPVIVIGRLCRSEAEASWVRPFAEARPAPILVRPQARGVVPDPHPLLIGTLGAGEGERALIASADLIVAIGVDEADMRGGAWPESTPVLHITPVIAETPPTDRVAVAGDIGLILEELAPRLRDRRLAEWDVARLHALKQAAAAPPAEPRRLAAYRVVEAARRLTPAGAIAVFERGEAWTEADRAWPAVRPGECLVDNAPGFALAVAIAARLSRPDRRVVCFTNADAIGADPGQLEVAARLGVPVVIVVSGDVPAPGPGMGLRRFDAASPSSFAAAFEAALVAGAPALLTSGPK